MENPRKYNSITPRPPTGCPGQASVAGIRGRQGLETLKSGAGPGGEPRVEIGGVLELSLPVLEGCLCSRRGTVSHHPGQDSQEPARPKDAESVLVGVADPIAQETAPALEVGQSRLRSLRVVRRGLLVRGEVRRVERQCPGQGFQGKRHRPEAFHKRLAGAVNGGRRRRWSGGARGLWRWSRSWRGRGRSLFATGGEQEDAEQQRRQKEQPLHEIVPSPDVLVEAEGIRAQEPIGSWQWLPSGAPWIAIFGV